GGAIQCTGFASASLVRQMPPPAAATQSLQLPVVQAGSIASAVTRPDSCVAGPVCVVGSKNCESSPATLGVTGPSAAQACGVAARSWRKGRVPSNAQRGGLG